MVKFIDQLGLEKRKSIELTSNEAVKQAVLAGLGYSVMPLIGIRGELQRELLEIVPMDGLPITTFWNIVYLSNKELSPVAQAYLDFINEHKDKVISEQFHWYDRFVSS